MLAVAWLRLQPCSQHLFFGCRYEVGSTSAGFCPPLLYT